MPASAEELLGLLNLTPLSDGRFTAPGPARSALPKAFGGQYLAQSLLASELHVGDSSRIPHALQGTFLSAGDAAARGEVDVSKLRDGRSFSMRRAQVRQGARVTFDATVSLHIPETGYTHAVERPDLPAPDECLPLPDAMDRIGALGSQLWRDEWPMLDMRYAGGATDEDDTIRSTVPSSQRFWLRMRDPLPDDPRLHRAMVAYFSDFWLLSSTLLPHGFFVSTVEVPRSSLNHALWFHATARADEWLLFDQTSAWAGSGRAHGTQRIFSEDGTLVATVAQEGLIRPVAK